VNQDGVDSLKHDAEVLAPWEDGSYFCNANWWPQLLTAEADDHDNDFILPGGFDLKWNL